ncbi:MAG: type II toxin-antitoxin system Phd/YefM family antitoxin [Pseudomonadota bacterium]
MICLPLHEARNQLAAIVHEAEDGATLGLTRHGKPVAVLMGMETLAQLESSGNGFARRYARFLETWKYGEADGSRSDATVGGDSGADDLFQGIRSVEPGRPVDL